VGDDTGQQGLKLTLGDFFLVFAGVILAVVAAFIRVVVFALVTAEPTTKVFFDFLTCTSGLPLGKQDLELALLTIQLVL